MKIQSIRLGMLEVPLKTPFKTAMRTVKAIEDVVVIMETDTGHIGYGSAPATAVITGETHGSIIEALSKIIAPALIGRKIEDLNALTDNIQNSIVRNFSANAAAEIAIYDLYGQLYNAPL
jgi:L-alanine-DL-glutamate epimerase-like enolase superfamily enzyme